MTSTNDTNRTFGTIVQYGEQEKQFYERLFERFKDAGDKISANVRRKFKIKGCRDVVQEVWAS